MWLEVNLVSHLMEVNMAVVVRQGVNLVALLEVASSVPVSS